MYNLQLVDSGCSDTGYSDTHRWAKGVRRGNHHPHAPKVAHHPLPKSS